MRLFSSLAENSSVSSDFHRIKHKLHPLFISQTSCPDNPFSPSVFLTLASFSFLPLPSHSHLLSPPLTQISVSPGCPIAGYISSFQRNTTAFPDHCILSTINLHLCDSFPLMMSHRILKTHCWITGFLPQQKCRRKSLPVLFNAKGPDPRTKLIVDTSDF